jgi:5-(hydroxymethyl)furfural/furfural oxidase
MEEFDVIVVGGGAAGCIVAARLSENKSRRVLLVEAGSDVPPDRIPEDIRDEFPVAYSNPEYFWRGMSATGRAGLGENAFPQARVLGGGSSVMGMWALRGRPSDFDAWRDAGAAGWAWDDVLPYFRRLETDRDYAGSGHGKEGPIPIRRHGPASWPRFATALTEAAEKRGIPLRDDINEDDRDGVFPVPVTNDERGRVSAATGYLTNEVRRRTTLRIISNAEVARIEFAERRVTGLTLLDGRKFRSSQVICSAGSIGSPWLLLRSGVGPADELSRFGISPILDAPGVGKNLQNHCIVNFGTRLIPEARQTRSLRTYGLACVRLSSRLNGSRTGDLHLQFVTRTSLHPHGDRIGLVGAALYAPVSRGVVSLSGPGPERLPKIDFKLLEEEIDRRRMKIALNWAMQLLADPGVSALRDEVFTVLPSSIVRRLNRPGTFNYICSTLLAAALDAPRFIRKSLIMRAGRVVDEVILQTGGGDDLLASVSPIFHPAGTCAMGGESNRCSVVDSNCRVRGVAGLSVIDASIMPLIPTGNTCLPTMMIAERASDLFERVSAGAE